MWVFSRCAIAAWLECFQEKPRTVSDWTGLPGEESVKRFERSNGPYLYLYLFTYHRNKQIDIFYVLFFHDVQQLTLCLPKTEISVFQRPTLACQRRRFPSLWRNVCFSHPHVTNYICSHCMMFYTVRKKKFSSLFWYKAIIVWFSQFIMTIVQN